MRFRNVGFVTTSPLGSPMEARPQRPRGGDTLDNRVYQPPNSHCSDLSSLLDDLSSCVGSRDDYNNSYAYPACLKAHRDEQQRQCHQRQQIITPVRGSNISYNMQDGYGNEYFPLDDSFSDLLHPDRSPSFGEAAGDHHQQPAFPPPEQQHQFPSSLPDYSEESHDDYNGYPMSGIEYPGSNDVMLGRGGATNQHVGNIRFRQLVAQHKVDYITAAKGEKPAIALHVVNTWRSMNPPGRFLQKSNPELGDESCWHDVGEKEARKKASQCLREKTPDIAPILKKLNEEQQIEEEKMKRKGSPKRDGKQKAAPSSPKKVTPPLKQKTKEGKLKKMKDAQIAKGEPAATLSSSERAFEYERIHSESSVQSQSHTPSRASRAQPKQKPPPAVSGRVGPRLSLVKERKTRHIREEVSDSIPSAASLVAETFGDVNGDDSQELESSDSFSLLPADLQELMQASSIGNMSDSIGSFSNDNGSSPMETLSTSTWFRSFRSFENSQSSSRTPSNRTMMSTTSASLRGIREEQSGELEESIDALDLAFPSHDEFENRAANIQKLTWARSQVSNFSLLSDLTGESSNHRRRMRNARIDSGVSATSELTDMSLSDSLKGMDLASLIGDR